MAQTKSLPPRPNLEHLKKQAKDLLKKLRESNPKAKLSEAMLNTAREYGFGSWRQLVARVQSVTGKELERIAQLFTTFAAEECRGRSPLYERLSKSIAQDQELQILAGKGHAPIPDLFLAAVQYLLLHLPSDPLARFYPNIDKRPDLGGDPFPAFKAFCRTHESEILDLMHTRSVQTNEVARSGYLLPAINLAWSMCGQRPLALIEVGTSAGLNLCFDQFAHHYEGDTREYGNPQSAIFLSHQLRGKISPLLPDQPTPIAQRIGIDLKPIFPADSDGIAWLEALIWPEHQYRRQRLRQTLSIASAVPRNLIEGDASQLISKVLNEIPEDQTACVFQTHSLNQFSSEVSARFFAALERFGANHRFAFISRHNHLTLDYYDRGVKQTLLLAECDAHGEWIDWRYQVSGHDEKIPRIDLNDLARRLQAPMERAWAESCMIIERRFDAPGNATRWEATGLESPTLREREADEHILKRNVMGQYRMISIWQQAKITETRGPRVFVPIKPTRSLEFLRPGEKGPLEGEWRRIDWRPTNQGFSGKPARWDDLAEALTYLCDQAPPGEYRMITIRRMLFAQQQKDRIKINKKHAGLTTLERVEQSVSHRKEAIKNKRNRKIIELLQSYSKSPKSPPVHRGPRGRRPARQTRE